MVIEVESAGLLLVSISLGRKGTNTQHIQLSIQHKKIDFAPQPMLANLLPNILVCHIFGVQHILIRI